MAGHAQRKLGQARRENPHIVVSTLAIVAEKRTQITLRHARPSETPTNNMVWAHANNGWACAENAWTNTPRRSTHCGVNINYYCSNARADNVWARVLIRSPSK